jgi:hypothetical protein
MRSLNLCGSKYLVMECTYCKAGCIKEDEFEAAGTEDDMFFTLDGNAGGMPEDMLGVCSQRCSRTSSFGLRLVLGMKWIPSAHGRKRKGA